MKIEKIIEKEIYDLPLDEAAKIQVTLNRTKIKSENNSNIIKYIINFYILIILSEIQLKKIFLFWGLGIGDWGMGIGDWGLG